MVSGTFKQQLQLRCNSKNYRQDQAVTETDLLFYLEGGIYFTRAVILGIPILPINCNTSGLSQ